MYDFPVSKTKKIRGNRRLAREKVLQTLMAYFMSDTDLDRNFTHIFYRIFSFDDRNHPDPKKLLRPEEVLEIEADVPIEWSEDEMNFARSLINGVLEKKELVDKMLTEHSSNWDLRRIVLIDKILIYMAIAEILTFPDVPTKVSVNEAIEISKFYSTEKSGFFINGVLEALIKKLEKEGKVKKFGKGLLDKEKKNRRPRRSQNDITS